MTRTQGRLLGVKGISLGSFLASFSVSVVFTGAALAAPSPSPLERKVAHATAAASVSVAMSASVFVAEGAEGAEGAQGAELASVAGASAAPVAAPSSASTSVAVAGPALLVVFGPPTDSKTAEELQQRSNMLIRNAHDLLSQNRPEEALELMTAAWQLESAAGFPNAYELRCDLGLITAEMEKWRAAATHLTYCMQLATPEKKASEPRLEQSWADDLAKAKAEIVTLSVHVNVRGAAVKVNGEVAGLAPLPGEVFADPGQVTVVASAAGYKPGAKAFMGAKGQSVSVPLELVKDPNAPSPGRPRPRSPQSAPSAPLPRSPVPLFAAAGLTMAAAAVGAGMFIAAGTADAYAQKTAKGLNEAGGERACLDAVYRERCVALVGAADEVLVTRVVGIGALAIAAGGGAWMTYELVKGGQFGASSGRPKGEKRGGRAAPKPSVLGGVIGLPSGGGLGLRGRF